MEENVGVKICRGATKKMPRRKSKGQGKSDTANTKNLGDPEKSEYERLRDANVALLKQQMMPVVAAAEALAKSCHKARCSSRRAGDGETRPLRRSKRVEDDLYKGDRGENDVNNTIDSDSEDVKTVDDGFFERRDKVVVEDSEDSEDESLQVPENILCTPIVKEKDKGFPASWMSQGCGPWMQTQGWNSPLQGGIPWMNLGGDWFKQGGPSASSMPIDSTICTHQKTLGRKEESDHRSLNRLRRREINTAGERRRVQGLKPFKVKVQRGGIIDAGCEGKNQWDDMRRRRNRSPGLTEIADDIRDQEQASTASVGSARLQCKVTSLEKHFVEMDEKLSIVLEHSTLVLSMLEKVVGPMDNLIKSNVMDKSGKNDTSDFQTNNDVGKKYNDGEDDRIGNSGEQCHNGVTRIVSLHSISPDICPFEHSPRGRKYSISPSLSVEPFNVVSPTEITSEKKIEAYRGRSDNIMESGRRSGGKRHANSKTVQGGATEKDGVAEKRLRVKSITTMFEVGDEVCLLNPSELDMHVAIGTVISCSSAEEIHGESIPDAYVKVCVTKAICPDVELMRQNPNGDQFKIMDVVGSFTIWKKQYLMKV